MQFSGILFLMLIDTVCAIKLPEFQKICLSQFGPAPHMFLYFRNSRDRISTH